MENEKYFSLFSEKIYAETKNIFLFELSLRLDTHLTVSQKIS